MDTCYNMSGPQNFIQSEIRQTQNVTLNICSVNKLCPILCDPWTAACQTTLFFAMSRSLLRLMSIESLMPSNHLIPCHPLLLLPSIFSNMRVFSNESALHVRWQKYWSFNFSISSFNEYSGLISFRTDSTLCTIICIQNNHKR